MSIGFQTISRLISLVIKQAVTCFQGFSRNKIRRIKLQMTFLMTPLPGFLIFKELEKSDGFFLKQRQKLFTVLRKHLNL